jgi:CIC family chloride channel protein
MLHPLRERVTRTYSRFWSSETAVMLTMALVVGLGSGFGAVAFRWLIETAHTFFFVTFPAFLPSPALPLFRLQTLITAITPAVGGLIVGLITCFVAPEARGPGVSSVMEALALQGGRIRPLVIAARPIATSVSLGSGGSGGREGPVVQLGSAIGSALSQLARLSDERTRNLVACGAAGGVAATFNAPLAGVMFALEVLLAEFRLVQFTSVVVAAVVATVIGHTYLGDVPAFPFPASASPKAWELPIYALLGAAAAFVGVGFTHALYLVDDLFERQSCSPFLKPVFGGVIVGVVGLWFPQVLGIGYSSIEAVLFNRLTLISIAVLGLLKIVVTAITIGSGGSGGIFGPCLFIGAMLGGLFGQAVHQGPPGSSVPSSYALVGMSAVFAAASRAPITAILTLFEMTRDYNVILPLMLATVISAIVARHLLDDSIYTVKLTRRGIDIHADRNLDLMSTILVSEAMTPIDEITTVTPATPLTELARMFDETHDHGLFGHTVVVDGHRRLKGIVSLSDLERAQTQQLMMGEVADIQVTNVRTVFPDQTLKAALRHFGALDVGRIPVVDRANPRRVVGLLRRGDIVRAYSHAALDQQARLKDLDRARLERRTGLSTSAPGAGTPTPQEGRRSSSIVEIRLQDHHEAVGKTLEELDLPSRSLIASVRRGERVLIPRGNTRLEAGDVIVALVAQEDRRPLRQRLTRPVNHS